MFRNCGCISFCKRKFCEKYPIVFHLKNDWC
jgi:hypothetical protein